MQYHVPAYSIEHNEKHYNIVCYAQSIKGH